MDKLPERKQIRLPNFDYSTQATYAVTISAHERKNLFWTNDMLNDIGEIIEEELLKISSRYSAVKINNYAIMPNHVHILLTIGCDALETNDSNFLENYFSPPPMPNLKNIIGLFKAGVTRRVHLKSPKLKIWQSRYYDHIVKNQDDYFKEWNYIENNVPAWFGKHRKNISNTEIDTKVNTIKYNSLINKNKLQ